MPPIAWFAVEARDVAARDRRRVASSKSGFLAPAPAAPANQFTGLPRRVAAHRRTGAVGRPGV